MIYIANPLYDTVFKYMLEDLRVARIFISAILQKKVIECNVCPQEFTRKTPGGLTLYRVDFSAVVEEKNGEKRQVLIELQKTWKPTETMRFRQYLGMQYINPNNQLEGENPHGESLPIVAIYILGHNLYDLEEPIVYVKRQYLDYDSNIVEKGVPSRFVESLTHDAIFVQLPRLSGSTRNRLEKILQLFDQSKATSSSCERLLQIDDNIAEGDDEMQAIVTRLLQAAASPDMAREMMLEAEFQSELNSVETKLALKDKIIRENKQVLAKKDFIIDEQNLQIEKKDQQLEEQNAIIAASVKMLLDANLPIDIICKNLKVTEEFVMSIK